MGEHKLLNVLTDPQEISKTVFFLFCLSNTKYLSLNNWGTIQFKRSNIDLTDHNSHFIEFSLAVDHMERITEDLLVADWTWP